MSSLSERLWRRVDRTNDCWVWTGCRLPSGYGMISRQDEGSHLTHRVAWELTNGPVAEGLKVLHRCDNPPCCNPAHLFVGTQQDNIADMNTKGRHGRTGAPGARNGQSKLTDVQVQEIRSAPRGYGTGRALAKRFGVSEATVSFIRSGKRWQ